MIRKAMGAVFHLMFLALLLAPGLAAAAGDTEAQRQVSQPYNNAPVWRDVRSEKEQFTTTRGVEAGVLVQTAGEAWRQMHNGPVTQIGGWLLVVVVLAIYLFFRLHGPIKISQPPTGRKIERFTPAERMMHWTLAVSFVTLAISGLVMFFGKHVILPVIGYTLFGWLASICKALHNFIGPVFLVSVLVVFVVWAKDNLPKLYDLEWFAKGGGLRKGVHAPAGRFNAGEKMWFWLGMLILGILMSVTGLVLDFPNFEQGRSLMQQVNLIHAIGAMILVPYSLSHIYLGTVGMEGAYSAMRDGYVDESWAKEHHDHWYEDVKAGRVPAVRSGAGAPAASTQPSQAGGQS